MWQIVDDESYHGYFLSVYKYMEAGRADDDFEIRVREGNGLDEDGEWSDAMYIEHCESFKAAMDIGRAFVMGILTERETGVNRTRKGL